MLSEQQFYTALAQATLNTFAVDRVEDWGTGKGQGKRVKGMVLGGMSSSIRGKKVYCDRFAKLNLSREDSIDLYNTCQLSTDFDVYDRVRSFGLSHDLAMLAVYSLQGEDIDLYRSYRNSLTSVI